MTDRDIRSRDQSRHMRRHFDMLENSKRRHSLDGVWNDDGVHRKRSRDDEICRKRIKEEESLYRKRVREEECFYRKRSESSECTPKLSIDFLLVTDSKIKLKVCLNNDNYEGVLNVC